MYNCCTVCKGLLQGLWLCDELQAESSCRTDRNMFLCMGVLYGGPGLQGLDFLAWLTLAYLASCLSLAGHQVQPAAAPPMQLPPKWL